MSDNQSERTPCLVAWYKESHFKSDFLENDLFHSKSLGTYADTVRGLMHIGINHRGGVFNGSEVLIGTNMMDSSQDLRNLAKDCLEAAEWMDKNLPNELRVTNHGN